jgi:hypothetical protein
MDVRSAWADAAATAAWESLETNGPGTGGAATAAGGSPLGLPARPPRSLRPPSAE